MADLDKCPSFTQADLQQQVAELQAYMRAKGAVFTDSDDQPIEHVSETNIDNIIGTMVDRCDLLLSTHSADWQQVSDTVACLYGLVHIVTVEYAPHTGVYVERLSQRLVTLATQEADCGAPGASVVPSRSAECLRALRLMLHTVSAAHPSRLALCVATLSAACTRSQLTQSLALCCAEVGVSAPVSQLRCVLRAAIARYAQLGHCDECVRVYSQLLGTYQAHVHETEEEWALAAADAEHCVWLVIGDTSTYLFDELSALYPVQQLSGHTSLAKRLLLIFIDGRVEAYMQFHSDNQHLFVERQGEVGAERGGGEVMHALSHTRCLHKIRILALIGCCSHTSLSTPLTFEAVREAACLHSEAEVEQLVLDAVQTHLLGARLDQARKHVRVMYVLPLHFSSADWQHIRSGVIGWKSSLRSVRQNLQKIVQEMRDVAPQAVSAVTANLNSCAI